MKKENKKLREKELKKYIKYLQEEAKKFKINPEDLGNLYDLFYMIEEETWDTLKLNKMDKWAKKFHGRLDEVVIQYPKKKKRKNILK